MATEIDWTEVIVALITAGTSLATLLIVNRTRKNIQTPSGTSIGKQVEGAQHTALANHYLLRATTNEIGVTPPPEVARETQKVEEINGTTGE